MTDARNMRKLMEAVATDDKSYEPPLGREEEYDEWLADKKERSGEIDEAPGRKDPLRSDPDDPPSPWETDRASDKGLKPFNKDGYRTLLSDFKFTGVEGDKYKVSATEYDASINEYSEVDGAMIGWYNSDRNENVWIHIDDLKSILKAVEGKM